MNNKLTRRRFMTRLFILISSIALFQVASLELLFYHIMRPVLDDFIVMLTKPGWVVGLLLSSFMVCVYFYIKPATDFLKKLEKGEEIDEGHVILVQMRGLFFPYFMAAFAFPFYMAGGPLGNYIIVRELDWPESLIFYGFLGGIISSFMAAPMAIHGYHWIVDPVIRLSAEAAPGLAPSRSEGFKLSLRRKLTITIFSLVISMTGYTMLIGHTQNRMMYDQIQGLNAPGPVEADPALPGSAVSAEKKLGNMQDILEKRLSGQGPVYLILFIIAGAASMALAYLAAKEITDPVVLIRQEAERVSRGQYDRPVKLISNDEFSDLGAAFNRMLETIIAQIGSMNSIVDSLRSGIQRIDDTASIVAQICADQSSNATEQSAAVQQTSTTADQIAATARLIEERARKVDDVSSSALDACRDGEEKLEGVQQGFEGISKQVELIQTAMKTLEGQFLQTYGIVEIIEDIAEQSELLAVNAALEAAGAGEQGRRFGVVAEATRQLANKSMESAGEIRELIETIQKATQDSTRIAAGGHDKVMLGGQAIEEVREALQKISSLAETTSFSAGEITISTNEQTSASGQLASSMLEVQEVARKFETGAKEIETAITGLKNFAEGLRGTVEKNK